MASFRDLLKKKRDSPSATAGEPAPATSRGLMLRGRASGAAEPPAPQPPNEQDLLRSLGILPPQGVTRKLGETRADVPYVFPSANDSPRRKIYKAALLAEETRLGIWIDGESAAAEAWIAVEVEGEPNLLLLHRLPLLNRRSELSVPF